jgi:hypothetical protein
VPRSTNNYDPWGRVPPLPTALRLPGGFVVPIVRADRPSEALDEGSDGHSFSDGDGNIGIVLWKELTPAQAWNRLTHEGLHALVDWQRYIEIKTKRP